MPRNKDRYNDVSMETHDLYCKDYSCIFCLMREPDLEKRQSLVATYFKDLPSQASAGQAFAVSGLWTLAMSQPNSADLVELGVLECMASLIWKGIQDRRWLLQQQNIFVPYYAAHIIGSYTMNREDFAERAVKERVVPPLIELLRGRLTWVEQRVAVRALGHLASYNSTFLSLAVQGEVLELAMELAVCSLEIVYTHFVQSEEKRLRYHRDLLTRRAHGGGEMEARKAEEWASQLQCWSLQLINCFAFKEKYIPTICRPSFLTILPDMWGGLVNEDSPAGVGLLRTICQHKLGRSSVAACPNVVQALGRIARSSDDWQYMAVECLLVLLQDPRTRQRVMDMAAVALVDLAELPSLVGSRRKLGDEIVDTLLQDDTQSPSAFLRGSLSTSSRRLLDELASQRQRNKWERGLSKHEHLAKEQLALDLKVEGNTSFSAGDVSAAVFKYTEALGVCPARAKKERIVLYSNRAQCHLLLQDAEAAISDATRALCLARPVNCHGKSLWRRAQAYEMLGLAKESLLDAIMFVNECSHLAEKNASLLNQPAVPDYAEVLVKQQMKQAWLFKSPAMKHGRGSSCSSAATALEVPPQAKASSMPAAGSSPSSSVSTTVTTATRATMAPACKGAGLREDESVLGSDSEWKSASHSSEESTSTMTTELTTQQGSQQELSMSAPAANDKSDIQCKFTPRSKKFLHSLRDLKSKKASPNNSPLLPSIREEISKHQAGPGPLDTGLLKKSIYDLIQQNFLLERSRSTGDDFPVRDDGSYAAR